MILANRSNEYCRVLFLQEQMNQEIPYRIFFWCLIMSQRLHIDVFMAAVSTRYGDRGRTQAETNVRVWGTSEVVYPAGASLREILGGQWFKQIRLLAWRRWELKQAGIASSPNSFSVIAGFLIYLVHNGLAMVLLQPSWIIDEGFMLVMCRPVSPAFKTTVVMLPQA